MTSFYAALVILLGLHVVVGFSTQSKFSRRRTRQWLLLAHSSDADGSTKPPKRLTSRRNPSAIQDSGAPQRRRQQQQPRPRSGASRPNNNGNKSTAAESRQFNQEITKQESAMELLDFLAGRKGALSQIGGGGSMNSVNFSTSMHRIAKYVAFHSRDNPQNDRRRVLSDPRFALLLCSLAEAMLGQQQEEQKSKRVAPFGSREMSNIAWALAKLNIAPPQSALPIDLDTSEAQLRDKAQEVRSLVYQTAAQRQSADSDNNEEYSWIPALSELSGLVLDNISSRVRKAPSNLFRLQEWANLLWALATAKRAHADVTESILECLVQEQEHLQAQNNTQEMRPQEWSNSVWALATSGINGPEETFFPFVANLMKDNPGFCPAFKPQELSNTVWGVATVLSKRPSQQLQGPACEAALLICRKVAGELVERRGMGYKSQELTNTAWAFATLGFGIEAASKRPAENILTDYTVLPSDDEAGDRRLMTEALQVVLENAKANLRKFRSQELNNLSWTMARLDLGDEDLLQLIGHELGNPRRALSSQDISTSLWSMATLNFSSHPDIFRQVAGRFTLQQARAAKPQELSNTVWAMATVEISPDYPNAFDNTLFPDSGNESAMMERDPVTRCFAKAAQELMRRPDAFKPQEIKDLLWATSKVGIRHPALFRFVANYLVGSPDDAKMTGRGLDQFSAQGLGNLAWAYARQAQLGAESLSRMDPARANIPLSSGRLAHYTVSFLDVGEGLLQKLFAEIARVNIDDNNMSRMKPQDLSNTAWAFAILGMKHSDFLEALQEQLIQRMVVEYPRSYPFKSQEVTNALWALATLNHECQPDLLHLLNPRLIPASGDLSAASIASVWKRQELSNMAWVSAVLGEFPPDLVRLVYAGILGSTGEENNGVDDLYRDGGLQQSAVMSLTYLQMAMDLESDPPLDMALPPGFPPQRQSRQESSSSSSSSNDMTGLVSDKVNNNLQLKTSRIQQSVSQAFGRVKWDHVEEYVMDMDLLVKEHGIRMDAGPVEILSLDLANVASKVGVEVDGPGHFVTSLDRDRLAKCGSASVTRTGKLEYQFAWSSDYQQVNGATALKLRILKELGWTVHNIPFWEWMELDGIQSAEDAYCEKLLKS